MATEEAPASKRAALEAAQLCSNSVKDKIFLATGACSGACAETTNVFLVTGAAKVTVGGRDEKTMTSG